MFEPNPNDRARELSRARIGDKVTGGAVVLAVCVHHRDAIDKCEAGVVASRGKAAFCTGRTLDGRWLVLRLPELERASA